MTDIGFSYNYWPYFHNIKSPLLNSMPENLKNSVDATDTLPAKTLYVKTWGCQMNIYDTGRMVDTLLPMGYGMIDDPEDADMVILNTCHIREKATEKLFSELGRLKGFKQARNARGKDQIIAVAGCVAQAEGTVITDRAPYVDLVIGPQGYHSLPDMVREIVHNTKNGTPKSIIHTDFPVESKFDHLPEESVPQGLTAFLSIQEGCDKFCTFCVVPYTRGAEYSRPVEAIVLEAKRLAAQGTREISLLGQNVNAFHGIGTDGKTWGLGRLLRQLADQVPEIWRWKYTTSHPRDMDDDLIAAHGEIPSLMPFLHLPVQSGSDTILKAMNRKHTAEDYLRVIEKLRTARSDMTFSSDFIIGFPSETDRDLADTLKLVREVGFIQSYSFKYSPRPGTPAAESTEQIPEAIKDERLQTLQQLLNTQQLAFNHSALGKTLPVLFEKTSQSKQDKKAGIVVEQISGKTEHGHTVHVVGNARLIGNIINVKIDEAYANSIRGTLDIVN